MTSKVVFSSFPDFPCHDNLYYYRNITVIGRITSISQKEKNVLANRIQIRIVSPENEEERKRVLISIKR